MIMKKLLALAVALSAAAGLCAAPVSPVPQQVKTLEGNAFVPNSLTYKLQGAGQADPYAVAVLKKAVKTGKGAGLLIGEVGDKAVANYADRVPAEAQGYYLLVSPELTVIAGRDAAGTFYGVQTFLEMASDSIAPVEVRDWPAMQRRGVIEGFYGNPWSHADRLSQFDFYGRNKMNIYIYGPKDDPYHHSRWYEPYPADKAAEIKELIKHADANHVQFTWAMHPSNAIETEADRTKALEKFQRMYDLGVRSFAIFFDDISAKSVDAQISYLNFLDDKFVKTHKGVQPLTVCPTQYNKAWSGGEYLRKMGSGLHADINIMWTGNSVCDMIGNDDCEWFTAETTRKPFIWLNYPVNDYGMHNLLMGPATGNEPGIADKVAAFCSNPMQYAEASKVALYQLADFAWNPAKFNAEQSWLNATAALEPQCVDDFRIFCLNNVDVGPSVHGLRFYGETPDFVKIAQEHPQMLAASRFQDYFASRRDAASRLLKLADAGNPLLSEVREWIVALQLQSDQGLALVDMARALDSRNASQFIDAYKQYAAAGKAAEDNVSRNFEGSIQSVRVKTGTLHVAPWLKQEAESLINLFKHSGMSYPADLFPKRVLENGTYYIKHNGLWLGNPADSQHPVWQDKVDDINPNRQEWHINYDPDTERYSIRNSKDERYVNELGNFGRNPYSADWNTYVITEHDGKFAIRNAGNGGDAYWGIADGRLTTNGRQADYVFEIIPIK